MSCDKCGCGRKSKGLCPVSFGLALGITFAISVLSWSVWVMYYGLPPGMGAIDIGPITWGSALVHAFFALLKGFVFGLVLALIYDGFICCCRMKCCRGANVNCGCSCCSKSQQMKR